MYTKDRLLCNTHMKVQYFVLVEHYNKYTNPARGILDFCKQKFYRPLLCSPWTLYMYSMYTSCHELTVCNTPGTLHNTGRTLCNTPRTLRNTPRSLRKTSRIFCALHQNIAQHTQNIAQFTQDIAQHT